MDKKLLSERDICTKFILPAVQQAGWDLLSQVVAKVDALMALCDRLEASLTTVGDTRRHLLDALLVEALGSAPAEARAAAAE